MTEKTSTKDETKRGDAARAARAEKLRRRFPTIEQLRRRARWRVPRFAFDFVDGGANDEECARRNATALSAVELLPRYCVDTKGLSTEVELFGRRYAAPFGVAPDGVRGTDVAGGEEYLAREAQRCNIPFILATPANVSIERIAEIAPDVFWFQLYRFAANDHAITFDLLRRADDAGAHVLVPTIDSAGKIEAAARHPQRRDDPVQPSVRSTVFQVATSPFWAWRSIAPECFARRTSCHIRGAGDPGFDRQGDHAGAQQRQPYLG